MKGFKQIAQAITGRSFAKGLTNNAPDVCEKCFGTFFIVSVGPCKDCLAKKRAARAEVLLDGLMPERYRHVTLDNLVAQPHLHRDQAKIIEYMRAHPEQNYYLCGENDTGKTHFLWALCERAVRDGRNVIATTLHDWIAQNIESYQNTQTVTTFRLADLQQKTYPYSIFIDDVDKKKMTEYVAEMLFNFVDSVYRYKHQLVVTSQLDPEKRITGKDGVVRASLIEHFRDGDPRYGIGIARRIVNDETAIFRML